MLLKEKTITNLPLVEILLPTYNGEKYLKEQLNSLLGQTYKNIKITIRDDGSKDLSKEIISEYAAAYPDIISIVESNEASGSAKASFFILMGCASANYIMFCDQDDVWEKNKIELSLNKLLEIEEDKPAMVFTDLSVVDSELSLINKSFKDMTKLNCKNTNLNKILVQNTVTGCTVIMNKALLNICKKAKNTQNISMHDSWAALCASAFGNIFYLPTQTIKYRQHSANSVGAKSVLSFSYLFSKFISIYKIKAEFMVMVKQAEEFLTCYNDILSEKDVKMLTDFSKFNTYNKLKRVAILNKYKLYKNGFIRIIAQWVLL